MMDKAVRNGQFVDADTFLRTDQSEFGTAWRYELVGGTIIAHAAPSPDHGVILANLAGELYNRLRDHAECRPEIGSGAVPDYEQRNTARIPDAMIRCAKFPRVLFEVVSPSELQHKRQWDRKRADLQAVEGVQEIIEIFQDEINPGPLLSAAWCQLDIRVCRRTGFVDRIAQRQRHPSAGGALQSRPGGRRLARVIAFHRQSTRHDA